jgi:hypothetical protein
MLDVAKNSECRKIVEVAKTLIVAKYEMWQNTALVIMPIVLVYNMELKLFYY